MEFRSKTLEVRGPGLFVAFQRHESLQPGGALLGDATVGAILQMLSEHRRLRVGQPASRQIIEL